MSLQFPVFLLQFFQAFELGTIQATILGFPFVKGALAETMLSAQFVNSDTRFSFFEDYYNLCFCKS